MLNIYQKNEIEEILETLAGNLDISESQHNAAIKSYQAVGSWLTKDDSTLATYNPTIAPQGSFIIGTIIQPIDPEGDIDLDIVCELKGKNPFWTQKDLKGSVGKQLNKHKTYESLLDEEGRRCWTLKYRDNSNSSQKYHIDILPAVTANGDSVTSSKVFTDLETTNYDELLISITDKEKTPEYYTVTDSKKWLLSNPFGYAKWFMIMANKFKGQKTKLYSFKSAVKPTPEYQTSKLPLQRVIQLLKRHRDIMFKDYSEDDKKEKPISCIITTLAARAYNGEGSITDSIFNVINNMEKFIEKRCDPYLGKEIPWISNPVNDKENFADKWSLPLSKRERYFYDWMDKLKEDFSISNLTNRKQFSNVLKESYGEQLVINTFSKIADLRKTQTEQGKNKVDTKDGLLGASGIVSSKIVHQVKPHTFFGK